MFQAIVTKYLGPTNHRVGRVRATAAAGSIMLNWDNELNPDSNHARAAEALANKFGWVGMWYGGGLPSNSSNVYVCKMFADGKADFVTAERVAP